MKSFFYSFILIFITCSNLAAQQTKPGYNLTPSIGYGTENNEGNTAFYAGIAINKYVLKHIIIEANLTYFTTAIYNAYKSKPTNFKGEERWYNAIFVNTSVGYKFGDDYSLINAKIKIGPAIKYFDYKAFRNALLKYYPAEDRTEVIPGTVKYYTDEGLNISFYSGVNFDAKINNKLRAGLFLDTYSNKIWIEHFMPGIYATFKLGNKK